MPQLKITDLYPLPPPVGRGASGQLSVIREDAATVLETKSARTVRTSFPAPSRRSNAPVLTKRGRGVLKASNTPEPILSRRNDEMLSTSTATPLAIEAPAPVTSGAEPVLHVFNASRRAPTTPVLAARSTETTASPEAIELSSGVDDSDCEIQKILPSPKRRARRAAKGTELPTRQRRPTVREKLKTPGASEKDGSDCAIVQVQVSRLRKVKPSRAKVEEIEDSDCEIVKATPPPNRQTSVPSERYRRRGGSLLLVRPSSSAAKAETPSPKRQSPKESRKEEVENKSVFHMDLTNLLSSDSDLSMEELDVQNPSTIGSRDSLMQQSQATALPISSKLERVSNTAEPASAPSQLPSETENRRPVWEEFDKSIPDDLLWQLEVPAAYEPEPVTNVKTEVKQEQYESATDDEQSPVRTPVSSRTNAGNGILGEQKATSRPPFSSSYETPKQTSARLSFPTPRSMTQDGSPASYVLRPAYSAVVLADMHRKGQSGKFRPHHREAIIGVRSILKRTPVPLEADIEPPIDINQAKDTDKDMSKPELKELSTVPPSAKPQREFRGDSSTTIIPDDIPQGLTGGIKPDGSRRESAPDGGVPCSSLAGLTSLIEAWRNTQQEIATWPRNTCTAWTRQQGRQCLTRLIRDGVSEHAIKPTMARLQQRIKAGDAFPGVNSVAAYQWKSEWEPPHPRPPRGGCAMAAELEHRGVKTGTQYGNFWHNLMVEYSRLAGSPVPLFTMMKKAFDDFQEECMETRRDLKPQPKREARDKPLEGLEALLLWGAGDTDEDSPSSTEDEEDQSCAHKNRLVAKASVGSFSSVVGVAAEKPTGASLITPEQSPAKASNVGVTRGQSMSDSPPKTIRSVLVSKTTPEAPATDFKSRILAIYSQQISARKRKRAASTKSEPETGEMRRARKRAKVGAATQTSRRKPTRQNRR